MDINAALLTLIGELKQTVIEKDGHVSQLVKLNNELAQQVQDTKQMNARLVEDIRILQATRKEDLEDASRL